MYLNWLEFVPLLERKENWLELEENYAFLQLEPPEMYTFKEKELEKDKNSEKRVIILDI